MSLLQIKAGPSALSAEAIMQILQMRTLMQQLGYDEEKSLNNNWAEAAKGSATAQYNSVKDDSSNTLALGIGEISAAGLQLGMQTFGDVKGKSMDSEIEGLQKQSVDLKAEEESLGKPNQAAISRNEEKSNIVKDGNSLVEAQKTQASSDEQSAQAKRRVAKQRETVEKTLESKQKTRESIVQQYMQYGQMIGSSARGSAQIAASHQIADKASQDAARTMLDYLGSSIQSVLSSIDKMVDTGKSGISSVLDASSTLSQANVYRG